jgi:hypothetical protein
LEQAEHCEHGVTQQFSKRCSKVAAEAMVKLTAQHECYIIPVVIIHTSSAAAFTAAICCPGPL